MAGRMACGFCERMPRLVFRRTCRRPYRRIQHRHGGAWLGGTYLNRGATGVPTPRRREGAPRAYNSARAASRSDRDRSDGSVGEPGSKAPLRVLWVQKGPDCAGVLRGRHARHPNALAFFRRQTRPAALAAALRLNTAAVQIGHKAVAFSLSANVAVTTRSGLSTPHIVSPSTPSGGDTCVMVTCCTCCGLAETTVPARVCLIGEKVQHYFS
jgi:hypothetical protein